MKKQKQNNFLAWIVWSLAALFYFYEFLLQVAPSVMVHDLMRDFSVNATALGKLSGVYFLAYACMQIPVGILLDKFGSRRLLTMASCICAIGCFIFGSTTYFPLAELGRFLTGLGSAFACVGCMNIAARWFKHERFAFFVGFMLTIGMLGAIFGQAPLALLINHFGWRHVLIYLGISGLIISVLIYWIITDSPKKEQDSTPKTHQATLLSGIKHLLLSPQSWITATYSGLMYLSTIAFGTLWGVPFLMRAHDFSRPVAAGIVSSLFIGWAVGAPFYGWFSNAINRRKLPMYIASIFALAITLTVIYLPNLTKIQLILLLLSFGFFASGLAVAFSTVREINPPQYSATSLGFTNMFNMVLCAALQPIIGIILDHFWQGGVLQDQTRMYSITNYHIALSILPLTIFIALLLIPFIKETYCSPVPA
jgi:MFS family permease